MLQSRPAEICRSHGPTTGMTNATLHHNVNTVGQPTENAPDIQSGGCY